MKKFSIIVPAYNVEEYITKSFDNILNQTFKDFEVICVDDCSTDNTLNKINTYVEKDSRFKLIKHEKNKGPSSARNTALDYAKGQYIVFLDPDDYLMTNALERIYYAFNKSKADSVWYDAKVLSGENLILNLSVHKQHPLLEKEGFYSITSNNITEFDDFVWDKAFKHSVLKKLNFKFPDGLLFEDAEFYFKIYTQIKEIYYLPEYLYVYRLLRDNSLVYKIVNETNRELDLFKIFRNIYEYAKQKNLVYEYRQYLLKTLGICIKFYKNPKKYEGVVNESLKIFEEINFPQNFETVNNKKD